ncbi:MAG TPA: aldehyde dehydrogenase family protein [Candidatus Dormibacteraeota bacterium]
MAIDTRPRRPEVALVDRLPRRLLIGGAWVDAQTDATFDTVDPATGEVLATLPAGTAADVDRAVRAARTAFEDSWRHLSPAARGRCLLRLADLIDENAEELATIETLDVGKPLTESQYIDMAVTSEVYRYYGGWATKITGQTLPVSPVVGSAFAYTRREPYGVVGCIVPWNFPFLLTAWKLGPALAAGNTIVLKPAENTSLSSLRLGELFAEAGFPDGVLNIVTGLGHEAGQAVAEHPGIDTVSFTGSTATGRRILQASVSTLHPVHLELGGKSPNIVLADANLDDAVQGAFTAIFVNQGQVCCAGSRLYVERSVHDEVVERLAAEAEEVVLGHGLDADTTMGPLVSEVQQRRVAGYVEEGVRAGASCRTGGGVPGGDLAGGYFYQPTLLTGVSDDMTVAREEIFGPVLSVMSFDDIDEVVRRANDSTYGLAAGIWTRDISKAHRIAHALQAGLVWINAYNMLDPAAPFGGYKQSGFGRDLGEEGLNAYTQTKTVWVGLD